MKRSVTAIVVSMLMIFAGVVLLVTMQLRGKVRAEVLQREASILNAIAQREARHEGNALLDLVLRVVDMEGVVGVRVFDSEGRFLRALPDDLIAGVLDENVLGNARNKTRLSEDVWLGSLYADPFGELGDQTLPLLYVTVPIRDAGGRQVKGYVEFLMDGRPTVAAFRRLDRDLLRQALTAFSGGGLLIVTILLLSFLQLAKKNRDLAKANRELSLHARTAAIGAVSSHLFHGIKNALCGLNAAIQENGDALPDAQACARRIQQMVQEVIDVISEEQYGTTYDLSAEEVLDLVRAKTHPLAESRGVRLETDANRNRAFANREANLLLLALENLVHNAIEASDAGQVVTCRYREDAQGSRFIVTDQGPGIPSARRAHLFEPGRSAKANGSGIGLSISHQLCRHVGAQIRLIDTGPEGTTFEITVKQAG